MNTSSNLVVLAFSGQCIHISFEPNANVMNSPAAGGGSGGA